MVPVTPLGKAISVFAIIGGLTMIALPIAIISKAFADEVRRRDFVVTWGMLARVPLFSHLSASEIADIMGSGWFLRPRCGGVAQCLDNTSNR